VYAGSLQAALRGRAGVRWRVRSARPRREPDGSSSHQVVTDAAVSPRFNRRDIRVCGLVIRAPVLADIAAREAGPSLRCRWPPHRRPVLPSVCEAVSPSMRPGPRDTPDPIHGASPCRPQPLAPGPSHGPHAPAGTTGTCQLSPRRIPVLVWPSGCPGAGTRHTSDTERAVGPGLHPGQSVFAGGAGIRRIGSLIARLPRPFLSFNQRSVPCRMHRRTGAHESSSGEITIPSLPPQNPPTAR
jgi:hypothetical protein